jgi:hypothetical protein
MSVLLTAVATSGVMGAGSAAILYLKRNILTTNIINLPLREPDIC